MSVREAHFQSKVLKHLRERFPGCEILRGDAFRQQGIPDVFVFWNSHWGSLEFKASVDAHKQPNQDYYVEKLNNMSFAAYIYPENEEEVLNALEQAFTP